MTLNDILSHPLMALFVTIGSFLAAQWFQKKMGGYSFLNPVVIAIVMIAIYIVILDIPYKEYLHDVNLIHGLLGPATVALALPLYHQLSLIKKSIVPISISVVSASLIAAGVAYYLTILMGSSEEIQLAIIPKSTTAAIAISIAEKISADPSLVVFFVFTTSIIGSLIATSIFRVFKITDERAIGLSLGATCHSLGVATAFQYSEKSGAFAVLGMSLMGIVSGILLPFLVLFLIL
ncbi:MAG: LrgB family protein [Nitrosomonadaceae bacterium]